MVDVSLLGLTATLPAAAISFVSPCVLPPVPGYVSYVAGRTATAGGMASAPTSRAVWLSLCFVLGFSTIFIALGASATAMCQALRRWLYELNLAGGVIVILLGLFMIGATRLHVMERDFRFDLVSSAASLRHPTFSASHSVSDGRPASARSWARS